MSKFGLIPIPYSIKSKPIPVQEDKNGTKRFHVHIRPFDRTGSTTTTNRHLILQNKLPIDISDFSFKLLINENLDEIDQGIGIVFEPSFRHVIRRGMNCILLDLHKYIVDSIYIKPIV